MTRKLPADLARLTGAASKNPARYKSNHSAVAFEAIGDPPDWLNKEQREAWLEIVADMPWLQLPHTGIVSITAVLLARLRSGEMGISAMNLLRLCLGQLGATPTDAHKVAMPAEDEDDDLADEFFR